MHQANKGEEAHIKGAEKSGIQSHQKPHPLQGNPESGGNSKRGASPWGGKVWTPHWGPPAFKTSTWETSPQTSSFEYRRRLEAHQVLTIWEMTLKGLVVDSPAPGLHSWRTGTQIVVNEAHLNVGLRAKHRIQHTPGPCWLRAPSSILALVSGRRLFFSSLIRVCVFFFPLSFCPLFSLGAICTRSLCLIPGSSW